MELEYLGEIALAIEAAKLGNIRKVQPRIHQETEALFNTDAVDIGAEPAAEAVIDNARKVRFR